MRRLARAGIEQRTALPDDTHADAARFFSSRRTRQAGGERFGLMLSAIALVDDRKYQRKASRGHSELPNPACAP
jgi:copper oxidase (laccase) domain-containing protein